jgi:hypothetical protein
MAQYWSMTVSTRGLRANAGISGSLQVLGCILVLLEMTLPPGQRLACEFGVWKSPV